MIRRPVVGDRAARSDIICFLINGLNIVFIGLTVSFQMARGLTTVFLG